MSDRERNFPDLGFEESEASQSHWEDPDGLPPEDWEDADALPPEDWEDPDALPPDDWEGEDASEADGDADSEDDAEDEGSEDGDADVSDEPRAIDLIRQSEPPRQELLAGERLSRRVNARWNTAPGSERRSRLFARMGRPDPYDPDAKERPISMGSVALKLDGKRQPAPHARPKERKKKKQTLAPNVPSAPRPKPRAPAPAPKPKAAAPPPEVPRKADGTIDRRPPRVAAPQQKTGFFSPPQGGGARPASTPSRSSPTGAGRSSRGAQPRLAAGRSRAERSTPQPLPEGVDRTPPKPKTKQKKSRAGRLRMSRQEIAPEDRGPVVIEAPKLREAYTGPDPDAPQETKPPAPEPQRRIHKEAESLDDLFGFSQNEGRLRMPRRQKPGEDE